MRKRLFSILLAQCMVLNFVPITAFAEDSTEETPECTCETTCTEETMNAECPVCGAEGALPEKCGKYVEPAVEGEASQPEGEKNQEKQNSDMPDTQSEAALAQMSGEGENGIAVQNTGIAINPTNFPDVNFRSFVAGKYDTDGDEYLSNTEIAAVTELNCYNRGISDLTGIGHFTALTKLSCNANQLTSLDVSNTALGNMNCSNNQLTSLDLSKNFKSIDYTCDNNIYQIALDENRTFDLSTLPGSFDVSKASSWNGGSVSGNTLTVDNDKDIVTYTYDCGKGNTAYFTLKCVETAQNLNLYVNGEQFTSEKLSIACGEGTASYDSDTKTLTLNNATITNGGKSDESPKYGIRVVGDTDLTIQLSGTKQYYTR